MRRRAWLAVLALLLLAGCRTAPPALAPLPLEDPRALARLGELVATASERASARGRARISVEGQRGSSFGRQVFVVERPASLRLEVLGVMGQRIAVLATDGVNYDLYRAGEPGLTSGAVSPQILLDVAGVPLTPEEAVRVLLGAPLPRSTGSPPAPLWVAAFPEGGLRVEVAGPAEGLRRVFDFDPQGLLVRYTLRAPGGEPVYEASYGDYREVNGSGFAHSIDLHFPASATRAQVRFQEVELDPEIPALLFRLRTQSERSPEARAPQRFSRSGGMRCSPSAS